MLKKIIVFIVQFVVLTLIGGIYLYYNSSFKELSWLISAITALVVFLVEFGVMLFQATKNKKSKNKDYILNNKNNNEDNKHSL